MKLPLTLLLTITAVACGEEIQMRDGKKTEAKIIRLVPAALECVDDHGRPITISWNATSEEWRLKRFNDAAENTALLELEATKKALIQAEAAVKNLTLLYRDAEDAANRLERGEAPKAKPVAPVEKPEQIPTQGDALKDVIISDVGVKQLPKDTGLGTVDYSWKARITNITDHPVTNFEVVWQGIDDEGFAMQTDTAWNVRLKPRESVVITQNGYMEAAVWRRVKKSKVVVDP